MSQFDEVQTLEYEGGVIAMDSGLARNMMAACYLVESDEGVAIIETGTNASVPRLLNLLGKRGWQPDDVRYVIVTHVHLDHAGGAGSLMQACPKAEFIVHPLGARHMIDPSRLEASVRRVYGDAAYERDYGELIPIDASRVREMNDGDRLQLGQRELLFRDTPGHARHHFCIWDSLTRGWFSGDTFGLGYRELVTDRGPFIIPSTTPIQFDPEALKGSIRLLMAADPDWAYLTHFGRVGDLQRLSREMIARVDELAQLGVQHKDDADRTARISEGMWTSFSRAAREHGVNLPEDELRASLEPDISINTQGIEHWLDHG